MDVYQSCSNYSPGVKNGLAVGPIGFSLTLCCFVVYSTRRFVLCLTLCHFVLVFFSPFSIAITSFGEEKANFSAFRTFVRFLLVWICPFSLPLGVWEGLRFVIVALPGLFSYPFFTLTYIGWPYSKYWSRNKKMPKIIITHAHNFKVYETHLVFVSKLLC